MELTEEQRRKLLVKFEKVAGEIRAARPGSRLYQDLMGEMLDLRKLGLREARLFVNRSNLDGLVETPRQSSNIGHVLTGPGTTSVRGARHSLQADSASRLKSYRGKRGPNGDDSAA